MSTQKKSPGQSFVEVLAPNTQIKSLKKQIKDVKDHIEVLSEDNLDLGKWHRELRARVDKLEEEAYRHDTEPGLARAVDRLEVLERNDSFNVKSLNKLGASIDDVDVRGLSNQVKELEGVHNNHVMAVNERLVQLEISSKNHTHIHAGTSTEALEDRLEASEKGLRDALKRLGKLERERSMETKVSGEAEFRGPGGLFSLRHAAEWIIGNPQMGGAWAIEVLKEALGLTTPQQGQLAQAEPKKFKAKPPRNHQILLKSFNTSALDPSVRSFDFECEHCQMMYTWRYQRPESSYFPGGKTTNEILSAWTAAQRHYDIYLCDGHPRPQAAGNNLPVVPLTQAMQDDVRSGEMDFTFDKTSPTK